ncbi:MAG: hypothetical protein HYS09_06045 [Chloroflexi bacterium]|nr:hypothetical protein [Chloroflexota bacterium]
MLEKHASAKLQVYAVWLPMYPGDERSKWSGKVLSDPRVVHLWDESRTAGRWFAEHVGFEGPLQGPVAWDVYYLYGEEARWEAAPSPLIATGCPVIGKSEELRRQLLPLLRAGEVSDR